MSILVSGAVTSKTIYLSIDNIGLIMEMYNTQVKAKGYPKKFTRISFKKALADAIKYVDCKESVEEVITQLKL